MSLDFQDVVADTALDVIKRIMIFALVGAAVTWVGGLCFSLLGPVPRVSVVPLDFFFEGFYLWLVWQIAGILPALITLVLLVTFIRTDQTMSLACGTLFGSQLWLSWYWLAAQSGRHTGMLILLSVLAFGVGQACHWFFRWRHQKQLDQISAEAKERMRLKKEQILKDSLPPR